MTPASSDSVAYEFDLHEHHGGTEFEPDRNANQHGRHECDNFAVAASGAGFSISGITPPVTLTAGTEHVVHRDLCADVCGHVPRNGDGHVERIEPELGDSVERDGSDGGYFDGVADEFDLHEHHGGADFEPDRNDQEHGRHERDDLSGRGIGSRVQHFRDHASGDVDRRDRARRSR